MEGPPRKLPAKRETVLKLLDKSSARLFLDPRRDGVVVPKWFLKQAELVLRVGYTLSPPIPDLEIGEEHIACTLSFNRRPTWCRLPFSAIYAVISDADGRGVVWPEDVPLESQLLRGPQDSPSRGRAPAPAKPKLAAVPDPEPAALPAEEAEAVQPELPLGPPAQVKDLPASAPPAAPPAVSKGTKRQLPPYLRVVK